MSEHSNGIEVTVRDLETGETETRTVWNNYILICAGSCHESSVNVFAGGTHQITLKGVGGQKSRAEKRWRSRLRGAALALLALLLPSAALAGHALFAEQAATVREFADAMMAESGTGEGSS